MKYLASIPQAAVSPFDPRTWPLALPLVLMLIAAAVVAGSGQGEHRRRVLRQVLFCAIPYASTVVIFPQFVSIHPHMADMLLLVPAAFLPAFWMLQRGLRARVSAEALVAWTVGVALAIMTNLLTVAQNFRTIR